MGKEKLKKTLTATGIIVLVDLLVAAHYVYVVKDDPSISIFILFYGVGLIGGSFAAGLLALVCRKWAWGTMLMLNILLGPAVLACGSSMGLDCIHRLRYEEYVFQDGDGSHLISIERATSRFDICDCEFYPGTHSMRMSQNYRDGIAVREFGKELRLYLENGDTLTVRNDTLYGWHPQPVCLERR